MVDAHEVDLTELEFNQVCNNNYIIMKAESIEPLDYILFRQTETGLFMMTQVSELVNNAGLKDEYSLVMLNKL